MTIKQVLLTMVMLLLSGCVKPGAEPLVSPYPSRQVWAIAPISNESGNSQASGLTMADHLARQLENASNIDVLAVNRVLAVMDSQGMTSLRSPSDVQRLMHLLGADFLVVGTITAWDPYDPPKMGMSVELYTSERMESLRMLNLRRLSSASTDQQSYAPQAANTGMPVSLTSGYFDAADPAVRAKLQRYGRDRSQEKGDPSAWRLYRINMNLYEEFVAYIMSWRLMQAEKYRYESPMPGGKTEPAPS